MNEKPLWIKFRTAVKRAGGLAIKFFCPTFTGLPDGIALLPGARVVFAEIKTTGKKPTPRQLEVHKQLRALGFEVWVIDSQETLNEFEKSIAA